ncbi:MAG: DUF5906 domain-containing protein [Lachnospiraceae bacterium]|nr:DUF5906 domain-containing protein [Lachnospiraceae bacterium]
MELLMYLAQCAGNQKNCHYPERTVVTDADQMRDAVKRDHVCAEYRNDRRSAANFERSTVVVMDCDNDHSDYQEDWITQERLAEMFPGVAYAIASSRHHWKQKETKCPRPRFHVYFQIHPITDAEAYSNLKKKIHKCFPFFDGNALDAARFIYGAEADEVVWHDGMKLIDEVLQERQETNNDRGSVIPAGRRNNTLSRFAGRIVKRYGVTDRAFEIFLQEADKCDPPMEEEELKTIWASATKFFEKKIQSQEGYIPPDDYNDDFGPDSLEPDDYSDIGQAKVFVKEYGDEIRYTPATDYIVYTGDCWKESKQQAVGTMENFLDLQLADAQDRIKTAGGKLKEIGMNSQMAGSKSKKLLESLSPEQLEAMSEYNGACGFLQFVLKRRDMKFITSALQAAKPMLEIQPSELDADPNLLNTPAGTYYLPEGIKGCREKQASDLITKQTSVSPGEDGKELWEDALNIFFCGDPDLIEYVQMVVGMASIGKVCIEALIIAFGGGRNGKSTFWNTISRVLGTYSGGISADALTVGCKRNVKPEMAELKGKRLVIAAELEEGMRLNTSVVKQLCSTDEICAEKKYKDPFRFIPSHMIVLYTNHLPRVGASDEGTWRRLIVIPFNARIEGKSDIKNYADYLVRNAGSYILTWIIEGARKVIAREYRLEKPQCVKDAIRAYRENNDWLGSFLDECCEIDPVFKQKSGEFYQEYRAFCGRTGDYTRSTTDFYAALEAAGFERKKERSGMMIHGVRLKEEDDFLE